MICPCCGKEFQAKGNGKYCESCRHRILDEYTKWRRMKTKETKEVYRMWTAAGALHIAICVQP